MRGIDRRIVSDGLRFVGSELDAVPSFEKDLARDRISGFRDWCAESR
jgi:hypothetical protein